MGSDAGKPGGTQILERAGGRAMLQLTESGKGGSVCKPGRGRQSRCEMEPSVMFLPEIVSLNLECDTRDVLNYK